MTNRKKYNSVKILGNPFFTIVIYLIEKNIDLLTEKLMFKL